MSILWSEIWFPRASFYSNPTTPEKALASSIHPTVERVTPATGLASTLRRSASDRPTRPSIASARTLTAGINHFIKLIRIRLLLRCLSFFVGSSASSHQIERSNPLLLLPVEKSLLLMLGWKFLILIIDSSWMKLLYDLSSSVGYDRVVVISGRQ